MPKYEIFAWDVSVFGDDLDRLLNAPIQTGPGFRGLDLSLAGVSNAASIVVDTGPTSPADAGFAAGLARLAQDGEIGPARFAKGTTIRPELVLSTGDFPAATIVVARLGNATRPIVLAASERIACGGHGDCRRALRITRCEVPLCAAQMQNHFARGTLIDTPHGAIAVEHLEDGDEVMLRNGDVQLLAGVGRFSISPLELVLSPELCPVRITAGALTGGRPGQDLVVSRQHRLLVDDWRAEYLFGEEEILIPAHSLLNGRTVVEESPGAGVEYFWLQCEDETLVCANGIWAETLPALSADHAFGPVAPALPHDSPPSIAA